MNIKDILAVAVEKDASDVHLVAGNRPVIRCDGALMTLEGQPVTAEDMSLIFASVTTDEQREIFQEMQELDFAYQLSEDARFRVNACWQQRTISMAFRLIRSVPPGIEELHLPLICRDLILRPHGLVLLTGPTGCGKTTTLAAMIGYLNHTLERRVITIEDPIEYIYPNDQCLITQREVGIDTQSFALALKHALRQDPDVILVGEMRDRETASMVLMAAETGHLVLSTGHAPSAPIAIERIVDLFPAAQQELAQVRLAAVLQAVLYQVLLPTREGSGRLPAVEIMLANTAVKTLIRENRLHQLRNIIATNSQSGMRTMDEALVQLYLAGLINGEDVLANCINYKETLKTVEENKPSDVDLAAPWEDM